MSRVLIYCDITFKYNADLPMISLSPSLRRRMLGLDGELGIWIPDEAFWLAPKFVADTIVIPGCVDATDAIRACISCSCSD